MTKVETRVVTSRQTAKGYGPSRWERLGRESTPPVDTVDNGSRVLSWVSGFSRVLSVVSHVHGGHVKHQVQSLGVSRSTRVENSSVTCPLLCSDPDQPCSALLRGYSPGRGTG